MNKTNNQIRREEFEKRRAYKGTLSQCQAGYDCPIFMNCLLEINKLKKQLEERDKVIDEVFELSKELKDQIKLYLDELEEKLKRGDISFGDISDTQYHYEDIKKIIEILERSKNVNSK